MTIKEFNNYPFTSKIKIKTCHAPELMGKWFKIYSVDFDAKEVEISSKVFTECPIYCNARNILEIKD